MAVRYGTSALVIKKTDKGEADQILTLFTKEFGKLQILGRAIRKIKSKLRPGAELFCCSEIEFIQGRTFKTLTDTVILDSFRNLRKDLARMKIVFRIAEIVDKLIKGEEKDKKIWRLLLETFKRLDSSSFSGLLIYYYFVWNFFSVLGYQIDLYHCFICQKKLKPETLYFDPEQGLICSECLSSQILQSKTWEEKEVSPEVIKILRLFIERDWDILAKLKISDKDKRDLASVSESFLSSI